MVPFGFLGCDISWLSLVCGTLPHRFPRARVVDNFLSIRSGAYASRTSRLFKRREVLEAYAPLRMDKKLSTTLARGNRWGKVPQTRESQEISQPRNPKGTIHRGPQRCKPTGDLP